MNKLILIKPTMEYEKQVMNYKKAFIENDDSFDGCAGLEDVNTYEEWLNFEERLSKKFGEQYVPSYVYLAVRENDNKVVGITDVHNGGVLENEVKDDVGLSKSGTIQRYWIDIT